MEGTVEIRSSGLDAVPGKSLSFYEEAIRIWCHAKARLLRGYEN
jgi:hypothetical protein